MITGLILSKNRASQLRLLLESIKLNAPNLFSEIKILYTSTDDKFDEGYKKLINEEILNNIVWQRENDFVQDFLQSLRDCKTEYICGIVDDCVIYKRLASTPQQIIDSFDEDVFCFSLRLGLNTTMQFYLDPKRKILLEDFQQSGFFIRWNWKEWADTLNYGYPISLDGHIFRTKELSDLSHSFEFEYLRQWEGVLAGQCREKTERDKMIAYKQSVLFSIPANCVQDPPLIAGQIHEFTEEKLNDLYLEGTVIDLGALEFAFQNVKWSHNEVPFFFKEL